MKTNLKHCVWALAIAGSMSTAAFAADREIKVDDRLDASADALTDMMRASDNGIPQDLIDKAHCVVVMPGMKKAGFIFGAEYGRGFAVCRRHGGVGWSAPAAMRSEGGSFGFQIGASDTDVVLLVMNDGGMKHLLSDKFYARRRRIRGGRPDWPRRERSDGRAAAGGNAVVFPFARAVRRHLADRRDASSGWGNQPGTLRPRRNQS